MVHLNALLVIACGKCLALEKPTHYVRAFPSKSHYHLATEVMWETEDGVQGLFFALGEREAMFFAICEFSSLSH